ncbi:MAG: hypothetical protein MK202_14175 [Tenacibaculum sp.]|nr:hypothetical protein [Tenacibaculum sp.]
METTKYTKDCRNTIKEFHKKWDFDKVKSMTLDKFVSVDDKTTFCYWVETETRHVGSITGSTSIKLGDTNPKKVGISQKLQDLNMIKNMF